MSNAHAEIPHDETMDDINADLEHEAHQDSVAIERQARRLGWRPIEEYKGPADKWVDAAEFVRQADEDLPRIRHANKTLERTVKRLEDGMQEVINHQQRQEQAAYERGRQDQLREAEARHKQAVEAGDTAGAEKALKDVVAASKPAAPAAPKAGGLTPEQSAIIDDWKGENPWFGLDAVMTDAAKKQQAIYQNQGMSLEESLERTTLYIQRKFPQEFEEMPPSRQDDIENPPPRRQPPAMGQRRNSSVRTPPAKPKAGSYEALTPEARVQCDRFVAAKGKTPEAQKLARAEWLRFATPDLFTV